MKKSITTGVVCALVLATAACGKTQDNIEPQETTAEAQVQSEAGWEEVPQKDTEDETGWSEENAADNGNGTTDEEVSEGDSLYEDFKEGKAKAKYRGTGDLTSYLETSQALQKGQSYSLEEIVKALDNSNDFEDFQVSSDVEYNYIDCGQDGEPELLVMAQLSAEFRLFMIIKEIDNELVICYDQDAWSRSDVVVNSDGTIEGSGSGGASVHIVDYAFVDAAGDYKFYYGVEENLTLFGDYYAYKTGSDYELIPTEGLDQDHLGIRDYYFEADFDNRTHYHSYFILDDDFNDITTDADYDDSNELKKRFTDAGIKTHTAAEIDQMLKDRASEIGYPAAR